MRDGSAVQQNVVRTDGQRSVLLSIIRMATPRLRSRQPGQGRAADGPRSCAGGFKITELFDQSVFVTRSVEGVLREGAIAAALTALMILMFLGSWRSTVVVMISIPLSILTLSLVVLHFLGETLNTMTLGGFALAVGILVDDLTVTIENTHRLLIEEGEDLCLRLHGAAGIAAPTLVSTLAISCVFTSVAFLDGPSKYLYAAFLAVVFAMLASYGLSRR